MAKQKSDQSKSHKSRKPAQDLRGVKPRVKATGGVPPSAPATAEPSVPLDNTGLVKILTTPEAPPAPKNPKDEWWYRPADSKARKYAEKIVVMRAAGHDDREIAKRMKTTEQSVRQYVYLAKKNGWLDAEDEPVDLEAELAMEIDRKIVRNIGSSLDGEMTNWQTHEMTIQAAKGRGIFKNHEKTEGGAAQMQVVAIQIVMPPVGSEDQRVEIPDDMMGGTPAFVEGEVVEP